MALAMLIKVRVSCPLLPTCCSAVTHKSLPPTFGQAGTFEPTRLGDSPPPCSEYPVKPGGSGSSENRSGQRKGKRRREDREDGHNDDGGHGDDPGDDDDKSNEPPRQVPKKTLVACGFCRGPLSFSVCRLSTVSASRSIRC